MDNISKLGIDPKYPLNYPSTQLHLIPPRPQHRMSELWSMMHSSRTASRYHMIGSRLISCQIRKRILNDRKCSFSNRPKEINRRVSHPPVNTDIIDIAKERNRRENPVSHLLVPKKFDIINPTMNRTADERNEETTNAF